MPVAQLDRVSDSDSEGRAFESHQAYQFIKKSPFNVKLNGEFFVHFTENLSSQEIYVDFRA